MNLITEGFKTIGTGLQRQAASKCSFWAKRYRIIKNEAWSWDRCWWTKELHDVEEPLIIRKGAQLAFTELAINRTLFELDRRKTDCLYLLPAEKPDAKDFSVARLDTAIADSDYLTGLFSDSKNIGLKRAGSACLYIRGSRSVSALKSIPIGFIVFDEYDEMQPEKVTLALERMSGQFTKNYLKLSTPTIPGFGIDRDYNEGTQEEFFFPCPSCSRLIRFMWPESIEITADSLLDPKINETYYKCYECNKELPHLGKKDYLKHGRYVKANSQGQHRSIFVGQMYSSTVSPVEMARYYFQSQSKLEYEMQFYNSKLGLPHVPKGAQITDAHINDLIQPYTMMSVSQKQHNRVRTMGVDVGKYIHYVVIEWIIDGKVGHDLNLLSMAKVIVANKTESFEHLARCVHDYQASYIVVDAQPERRSATKFCNKFPGRSSLCFYANNVKGNDIIPRETFVSVDRTTWLDTALGRFFNKRIMLPTDIDDEFRDQVKKPIRTIKLDSTGNPIAVYVSQDAYDHYAHSLTYAEIALPLAVSIAANTNIASFL